MVFFKKRLLLKKKVVQFKNFALPRKLLSCVPKEGRSVETTSPRDDHTETGLRTKPSGEQFQAGAYGLYRTCRLRITGKHLASS